MSISAYSPPEQVRAEVCAQLAAIDAAQARLRELSTFGVGNGFRVEVIETLETQVRRGQGLSYRMLGEALDPPEGDDAQFPATMGRTKPSRHLVDVLARRLRLTTDAVRGRFRIAADITVRRSLDGQPLAPKLPALADAVAEGAVSQRHVEAVRTALGRLPRIAASHAPEAEAVLVGHARVQDAPFVEQVGTTLAEQLNPDEVFDEQDRLRARGIIFGKQRPDGMSPVSGYATPELRSLVEAHRAAHRPGRHVPKPAGEPPAQPGSARPTEPGPEADDEPGAEPGAEPGQPDSGPEPEGEDVRDPEPDDDDGMPFPPDLTFEPDPDPEGESEPGPNPESGPESDRGSEPVPESEWDDMPFPPNPTFEPDPEAHTNPDPDPCGYDGRSEAQRVHDALAWGLRAGLASGTLGQSRGIPLTVIVTTTLRELNQAIHAMIDPTIPMPGPARTGGGSMLPMRDLIRMAAHSIHYLSVFDDHSWRPVYLGRSQRIASLDQRIICHARDRGCTAPGCAKKGYDCEVHHAPDWHPHGATDADKLYFGCDHDHAEATNGHATTIVTKAGRLAWQYGDDPPRTNPLHHPDELLRSPDDLARPDDE